MTAEINMLFWFLNY